MPDETENLPPRRQPGEPMADWRPRRDALARQLAGLQQEPGEDPLAPLVARLKEIEARLEALQPAPREVTLADGRKFVFAERDFLALSMAAIVASRTGGSVDLPLANGTVAEKLRIGELAEISRQLIELPA